jgi:hypothetical protein
LVTAAFAYWLAHSNKGRSQPMLAKTIYAAWFGICCVILWSAVSDTRQAVDRDQWLEVGTQLIPLPFRLHAGESYYTLDLNPKANTGLQPISMPGTDLQLWPENRQASGGWLLWHGVRCTIRNRGMVPLSSITFDARIRYKLKRRSDDDTTEESTIHHVIIPVLRPGDAVQVLLGTSRDDGYIYVYKPRKALAKLGGQTQPTELRTVWTGGFEPQWGIWLLTGPREIPQADVR